MTLELPDIPRWIEAHGIAAAPASWRRTLGGGFAVGSDTARTILGADLKTLYVPTTTLNVMHPQKISFLSTALDGSTTFEAWDHGALIHGRW